MRLVIKLTSKVNPLADPNWIGAWWISFLCIGVAGLFPAIPIFFFPNEFPGTRAIIEQRERERIASSTTVDKNSGFRDDIKERFKLIR